MRVEKRTKLDADEAMTVERLLEDVSGVAHNLKSAVMAVNGYIDLQAPKHSGEVYELARRSTGAMKTILGNLVFALRAYRRTEPGELSLNACVCSTVKLPRMNDTF
jgi:hypothetical protein